MSRLAQSNLIRKTDFDAKLPSLNKLDASVSNNKQGWNNDKCRCEQKELIDKEVCDEGFIWNPSNCECECDKSCDVGDYLDYESCKCKKGLLDKLVEEFAENIGELKIPRIALFAHENKFVCSYTNCIVLAVIVVTISIEIGAYFVFCHWYVKRMLLVLSLVLVFKQQFNELINGQTNKHQKSNLLFLQ